MVKSSEKFVSLHLDNELGLRKQLSDKTILTKDDIDSCLENIDFDNEKDIKTFTIKLSNLLVNTYILN